MSRSFSPLVCEHLKFYVYVLFDPRTDKAFYVGKGEGNRVFSHVAAALESPRSSDKLDQIRDIHQSGHEVRHIILRHGLDESEAYLVESVVIDLLGRDELANEVHGHHTWEYGRMTDEEIIGRYEGAPLTLQQEHYPAMLININRLWDRDMSSDSLYEATRHCWKVGPRRNEVKLVLATYRGIVREAYVVTDWYSVPEAKRWGFNGIVSPDRDLYVGRTVNHLSTMGAQNPVRYLNADGTTLEEAEIDPVGSSSEPASM